MHNPLRGGRRWEVHECRQGVTMCLLEGKNLVVRMSIRGT